MREGLPPFFAPALPPFHHQMDPQGPAAGAPEKLCTPCPACSGCKFQPCTVCRVAREPDARIATSRAQPQLTPGDIVHNMPRHALTANRMPIASCRHMTVLTGLNLAPCAAWHASRMTHCILPPPMPSIVSRLAGHTWRLVEHALLTTGACEKAPQRGARGKDTRCLSPCTPEPLLPSNAF